MKQDSNRKVVLISGATRGIGKELARQLSIQSTTVILGAREINKGEAIAAKLRKNDVEVRVVQLDVTDQASVDQAAKYVAGQYGKLDVLINNAGVGDYAEIDTLTLEIFERTYAVNVFGVVRLTQAMLPYLKKSGAGRIINLSSDLGSLAKTQDPEAPAYAVHLPAYNSSKTALNAITIQLAKFLPKDNIVINVVDPGFTATDLNGNTGTRSVEQSAAPIVALALQSNSPNGKFFFENKETAW